VDVAIAMPAGLAVGVVLGLLGAGGSLLTVPALMLLLGLSATDATGTSLVAVAMMAVAGVAIHGRAGRCSCREGLVFGAAAAVTAAGGGWLASALSDRILASAFVILLIGTAIWLVRRDSPTDQPDRNRNANPLQTGTAGAGVGALTGLLGVGGGFLIVPALVATRDMHMPLAVGTSQLIILVSALGGLAGRLSGNSVQWRLGLLFGIGGLAGATIGSKLADRAPADMLRLAFAGVAIAVAGLMIWQIVAGEVATT
jgi:uncharacterized membrane protein YfcA